MAKKNIGATLALYPSPVTVVGAMVEGKPTWTLVAHAGTVAHSHLMVSLVQAHFVNKGIRETKKLSVNVVDESCYADESVLNEKGRINYHVFKPVLFEFPTYVYFVTGGKVGDCGKMG